MADKSSLRYVQFYTSELLELGAQLDGEQFKTLLLAIAHYAADGAEPDLPKDLALVFCVYRVRVDAQNEKYDRKVAALAANGAKGGRKKKEPAASAMDVDDAEANEAFQRQSGVNR